MNLKLLWDKIRLFTSGENGTRIGGRTWWRRVERNHPMKLWSEDEFLGMESVQLQLLMAISIQRGIKNTK